MIKSTVNNINVLKAESGKHFEDLKGNVMGVEIWLGKDDKVENYKEVEDEKAKVE